MNSTIELLKNHRSIRKFKPDAISDETLQELILAGQAASSSSFIQAYSIIDITDQTLRNGLMECASNQAYVSSAPRFLVFCADNSRLIGNAVKAGLSPDAGYAEQLLNSSIDAALVAQNILIAAESLGLGGVYIGALRNNPERVIELLSLPEHVYPLFGMCLGYPDQDPGLKPRLPLNAVLHSNGYQADRYSEHSNAYDETTRNYYIERTNGDVSEAWSEQMAKRLSKESRPTLMKSLNEQGFNTR